MITWQDPVALALAALIVIAALGWRRWLIKRGAGTHCAQCTVGEAKPTTRVHKPTVIDVGNLRLGQKRRARFDNDRPGP